MTVDAATVRVRGWPRRPIYGSMSATWLSEGDPYIQNPELLLLLVVCPLAERDCIETVLPTTCGWQDPGWSGTRLHRHALSRRNTELLERVRCDSRHTAVFDADNAEQRCDPPDPSYVQGRRHASR